MSDWRDALSSGDDQTNWARWYPKAPSIRACVSVHTAMWLHERDELAADIEAEQRLNAAARKDDAA